MLISLFTQLAEKDMAESSKSLDDLKYFTFNFSILSNVYTISLSSFFKSSANFFISYYCNFITSLKPSDSYFKLSMYSFDFEAFSIKLFTNYCIKE